MPELEISITNSCRNKTYTITDISELDFEFPLEISITKGEESSIKIIHFDTQTKNYTFKFSKKENAVIKLDPNVNLLFKETKKNSKEKKQ